MELRPSVKRNHTVSHSIKRNHTVGHSIKRNHTVGHSVNKCHFVQDKSKTTRRNRASPAALPAH